MEWTIKSEAIGPTCKLEIPDELARYVKIEFGDLKNEEVIELSNLMVSWTKVMQTEIDLIKRTKDGVVQYENATALYAFWNQRSVNFKTILEQLSTNVLVRANVHVMDAFSTNWLIFKTIRNFSDVKKTFKITYYSVVKPVKYYTDLIYKEIYAITEEPFTAVAKNFTRLYNNLNLMWLTSIFFNQKKNMERLFEAISNSIADRVSNTLKIPELFKLNTEHALTLTSIGIGILDQWRIGYIECQRDIKVLSDLYFNRWAWEFDEDTIYDRLNFVRMVVMDLQKILEIVKTNVMNSKYLLNPFNQEQTFFKDIIREFFKSEVDIYNSNEKHIWKDTFDKFLVRFEKHIYDKISEWIDVSKDAVEDYKALRFFEKIMIRDKLMTKLHPKYAIVLDKFTAEMDNIASAFTTLVSSSPQSIIGMPTVLGNIVLARDLFLKAKTIARVIESSAKYSRADKDEALSVYGKFCKKVFAYENATFDEWLSDAVETEERQMRNGSLLVMRDKKLASTFHVNAPRTFVHDKELFRVLYLALQLHQLEFRLPNVLACLVVKREQIQINVGVIDQLVTKYNETLNKMDRPVVSAMDGRFKELKRTMAPALGNRFTYLSYKLPQFIETWMRSFKEFNRIYNEIESYETIIAEKLKLIEGLKYFTTNADIDNVSKDSKGIFKIMSQFKAQGNENVATITHAMTYIMEALNLIEKICYDLQTGYHKQMSTLYQKYENAIFEALAKMIMNNYDDFRNLINGQRGTVIVIFGRMVNDKFTLMSDIQTVSVMLTEVLDHMSKSLRSVPRWLRATNIRCQWVQNTRTGDRHLPYSFYEHGVYDRKPLIDGKRNCYEAIKEIENQVAATVRMFSKFYFLLGKRDRNNIDKFLASDPTLNDYGKKMEFFSTLADGLRTQSFIDFGCVRLDYSQYNGKLIERCVYWHSVYGDQMIREIDDTMAGFSDNIANLQERLNAVFRDCQGLEFVENAIGDIKGTVNHAELIFYDINRRTDFMAKHGITLSEEQSNQLTNIKTKWRDLYKEALTKNYCLEEAKTTAASRY